MGGKKSKTDERETSLNPHEIRKLKSFLESKVSNSELINHQAINKLWQDILVPDLLNTYIEFLMKQLTNSNCFHLEQFLKLYSALVKGDNETRALCIAALTSPPDYKIGSQHVVSYNSLSKVSVSDLEQWLTYAGLVNALHIQVLRFMYGLEPEETLTSLIPMANLPTTTTPICLDISQVVFINSLIPFENRSKWRLLFSTSIHGESFVKFVGNIMNQGPLLLVIECGEGSKFGGYISENVNPGPRWVGTEDSFLFKLSPKTEVFPSTGYNNHFVYLNMSLTSLPIGLGMGGQFDYWGLWIDSQFGNGECSESCTTYKNYNMIATKKKFHIRNLEVWGVGEPPPTAEERGERGPTSVLDKDAAASHILEMAGRQVHSKGLREEPKL